MYGENKFMKIFSLVAFVAFAAVSCWSTTESLFLSLEHAEIPKWVFWIAVIGLYVLTSICFKMLLDSFNQNIYMERRTLKMIVGLLGVLLLWIAFSMPTNSHTFFYKQMAKDVASSELTYLDGELQKLSSESAFH
jgi:protein-S-isoprenylcysteine O-methyltransferase Ste14